MQVLLVEDKVSLAHALRRALESQGHVVELSHNGEDALAKGRRANLQAILLDMMLPRMDGLSVLKCWRQEQIHTPVVILSARDAMAEIVRGLDAGADDYITKPFALDVLMARVRAAGRRADQHPVEPEVLSFEDLTLHAASLELQRGQRRVKLTRAEFAILKKLIRRPRIIVPRESLLEQSWAAEGEITEASLYVFISALRTKIAQPGESQLLHTVRGVGYTLRAEAA
jgi:two-component system response regulator MprA